MESQGSRQFQEREGWGTGGEDSEAREYLRELQAEGYY